MTVYPPNSCPCTFFFFPTHHFPSLDSDRKKVLEVCLCQQAHYCPVRSTNKFAIDYSMSVLQKECPLWKCCAGSLAGHTPPPGKLHCALARLLALDRSYWMTIHKNQHETRTISHYFNFFTDCHNIMDA